MTDKQHAPRHDAAECPTLTVRVPREMRDRLDDYCEAHDRKRSSVVRLALAAYFAKGSERHE